jgi:uncharacterized protein (DUF58 family)
LIAPRHLKTPQHSRLWRSDHAFEFRRTAQWAPSPQGVSFIAEEEVTATRRALKKAARREGKKEIAERE